MPVVWNQVARFVSIALVCMFSWGRPTGDSLEGVQAILTQANSDLIDGSTSDTNHALAVLAAKYHRELKVPVYPQAEVEQALALLGVPAVGTTPLQRDMPHGIESIEVARAQKDYCDEHKIRRVLVITTTQNIFRARRMYEKLGLEVVVPPDLPSHVFQKKLYQWFWRSPLSGYPYEFLARINYLLRGLI